tara:strand:+ start:320 stop:628 length:309 start_codon:yes stop_codon:yes gene_type:complete
MTVKKENMLELESVPLPRDFRMKRENLPENIGETLEKMEEGKSFFIFTHDSKHTERKVAALRSRIVRHQQKFPEQQFSVRKEQKEDKGGVRVYKLEDELGDY